MADYGHTTKGYSTRPRDEGWKPSYSGNGQPDHVCRPVLVDAEGRKQPIIRYTPVQTTTETYVTETFVEQVGVPLAPEYKNKYSSVPMAQGFIPVRDRPQAAAETYVTETFVEQVRLPLEPEYQNKYSSVPVRDRPPEVQEYISKLQAEISRPTRTAPSMVTEYKYGSPTMADSQYGAEKLRNPSNLVSDRPKEAEEFLTKNQMEASRPTRTTPMDNVQWRNSSNSPGFNSNNVYTDRYNDSDGRYRKSDSQFEPTMVTAGGRSTLPTSYNSSLSQPTSDIGTAVEYLKEGAMEYLKEGAKDYSREGAKDYSREGVMQSKPKFIITVPRRENYNQKETIDSREAARRYENFNGEYNKPLISGENYTGTIDSREARKKYGGRIV